MSTDGEEEYVLEEEDEDNNDHHEPPQDSSSRSVEGYPGLSSTLSKVFTFFYLKQFLDNVGMRLKLPHTAELLRRCKVYFNN